MVTDRPGVAYYRHACIELASVPGRFFFNITKLATYSVPLETDRPGVEASIEFVYSIIIV